MSMRSSKIDPFQLIGPVLGTMFGVGVFLALVAPESTGRIAAWLILLPAIIIGVGLVFAVISQVIGRIIR